MKTDARVRYTKMRIREAFYACLQKKPIARITVKEICDLAEINRATFYTHYMDVFDLLDKQEEDVLTKLQDTIKQESTSTRTGLELLEKLKDRSDHLGLLASENGDPTFASKVFRLYYSSSVSRMDQLLPGKDAALQDIVFSYIAGGCGSLMTRWIQGEIDCSSEALISLLDQLTAKLLAQL
ncbi:MAG: TetR family transcriptional regulator C-terminal domain-containing protein [Clostridiales bacterium]|nr:TetR family transcriptional regulator C-terminal domain-containing protein [Clostridiales bacterium]